VSGQRGFECSPVGDGSGFRGCGRVFGSLPGFDHHWRRVTGEDDPDRNPSVVTVSGTRCATDAELRRKGFERFPDGMWRNAAKVERTRRDREEGRLGGGTGTIPAPPVGPVAEAVSGAAERGHVVPTR